MIFLLTFLPQKVSIVLELVFTTTNYTLFITSPLSNPLSL